MNAVLVGQNSDTKARKVTAGLSAVGAGAGALGLAAGANELRTKTKEFGSLRAGWRNSSRLGRALIPAEIAGLGGELMATKLLHQDVKQRQQGGVVTKSSYGSGGQVGRRIREPAKVETAEPVERERVGKSLLAALPKVARPAKAASNDLAAIKHRALGSLSSALEAKGTVVRPVGKAKDKHPTSDGIATMGVDGTFLGQQAAGHLERAKIHRDRGNQLHMEAIEEESALKRRQALAHLRQAALLEHSAKQRVSGAVGALGLKDGMGSAGLKGGGDDGGGKVSKVSGAAAYYGGQQAEKRKAKKAAALLARQQPAVSKARRFDSEADRQRRLGAYSGIAAGAGIVTGEAARRTIHASRGGRLERRVEPSATHPRGGLVRANIGPHIGFRPGKGRLGAGLTAATVGLGALAAGTYKRGISQRNRTWD